MMQNFPEINHISQVLPHIEGYSEFIVAEREGYTVIDYKIETNDTFKMTSADDLGGMIRRECRGLIFDKNGNLIRRAFHKFFNVGQKEEVFPQNLDMSKPHVIPTKLDGSMVSPVVIDDVVYLATRMGVTDVAKEAMKYINGNEQWLKDMIGMNLNPIFEYVGPENKIVVQYAEPKLVLTAIRHMKYGKYLDISMFGSPFELVEIHDSIFDLEKFLKEKDTEKDREGYVIRFADTGLMCKIKNSWYVDLHRAKEDIQQDRNVITFIRAGKLDDLIPKLDSTDQSRVRSLEKRYWEATDCVKGRIEGLVMIAKAVYDGNKKRIALEFVPNLLNKKDAAFIFSMIEGKDIESLVESYIEKNLGSGVKFDELMEWMEG
jgi:RNA ligase